MLLCPIQQRNVAAAIGVVLLSSIHLQQKHSNVGINLPEELSNIDKQYQSTRGTLLSGMIYRQNSAMLLNGNNVQEGTALLLSSICVQQEHRNGMQPTFAAT